MASDTTFPRAARAAEDTPSDVYDDGYLRVEHDNFYASCGGRLLKLSRTEFLLLSRLTSAVGRVVKAEELWRQAWGTAKPYNSESMHVYIYRLRNKLAPFCVRIEAMINVGYRLLIDADARPAAGERLERRGGGRRVAPR